MASRLILKSFKNLNASSSLMRFGANSAKQANTRLPYAMAVNMNNRLFSTSSVISQQESSNG